MVNHSGKRWHYNYDLAHWRSKWSLRRILPVLVYSLVAILSFAGGQIWQHKADSVGRSSSVSNSHSYRVGSLAADRPDVSAYRGDPYFSRVRSWVRIYDRPSGYSRHVKHLSHLAYLETLRKEREAAAVVVRVRPVQSPPPPVYSPPVTYGYYSCSALENLWIAEGGNSGSAFLAAEIATAESGGDPNAISPTSDYGLWQINSSHGAEASLNPVVNARAAIAISGDGTNWSAWTTYVSGAYIGRCLYCGI